jgi:putative transposase
MVKPTARREVVGYLKQAFGMSERRACDVAAICRATHRYRARNVSTGMRQLVVQFTVDSPRSLGAEPLVG